MSHTKRTPEEKAARQAKKELKRKQAEVDAAEPVVAEVAPTKEAKKAKKAKSDKKHEKKDESSKVYSYKQSAALTNLADKDVADFLELHNVQIQDANESESTLRPIMTFKQVEFPSSIQKVFVETLKFEKPSPIQYVSFL
jgi:hypothetical protein